MKADSHSYVMDVLEGGKLKLPWDFARYLNFALCFFNHSKCFQLLEYCSEFVSPCLFSLCSLVFFFQAGASLAKTPREGVRKQICRRENVVTDSAILLKSVVTVTAIL